MANEIYKGTLLEHEFIKKARPLMDTYSKLGLLDNPHAPTLKTEMDRAVMAQVLESTKTRLSMNEFRVDRPAEEILKETTTPIKTTAWSGATMIPVVLGFVRKMMPKMIGLELVNVQPMDRPTGRVFYVDRKRHNDGTASGIVEARAGWSYRSWDMGPGEATTIAKSVELEFTSADVTASSHKLKTQLSAEFQQDVQAYFGLDGVAMASDVVTDEFAMELDEIILSELHHNVQTTVYHGAKPSGYTFEEWDRRLIDSLVRADEIAFEKNRTYTNWIVCGSEMSVRLQRLATWETVPESDRPVMNANLSRIGTLNSRWKVYRATLPFPTGEAMLGYKGTNWTDAIMYYLPYVPLEFYGVDKNVETMVDTLSWLSRYATYIPTNASNGLAKVAIDEQTYTGQSYPAFVEWSS